MRIITDISLSLNEIANALNLRKNFADNIKINGITTDSRIAEEKDLFISLSGENDSGENHIDEARKKGAFILSCKNPEADFLVADTSLALLKIASYYKSRLPFLKKTIAITGSVGKTTVKNVLFSVLKHDFQVHATHANFNNLLGVSHTILTAPISTEYLICELGMNHLGEISCLSKAISPDIAVITNIGTSHIGNLGSRELIAKAKLEILDGMNTENVIIPMDEPLLSDICGKKFSLTNEYADYKIKSLLSTADGSIFDIITPNKVLYDQNTHLPGKNALTSILIASAVFEILGIDLDILSQRLPFVENTSLRGKYIKISDFTIFDDTYSSSPEAVIADFEYLSLSQGKTRSCVLGDMLELGFETERLHKEIGAAAYKYGFRKLYLFGVYAIFFAIGAKDAGMSENDIYINIDITSPEITAKQIMENHIPNETILIKASHALKADRIIDYLRE